MIVEIRNAEHASLTINTQMVAAVIIPSIVSGGDGMATVMVGQMAIKMPSAEAQKIVEGMKAD